MNLFNNFWHWYIHLFSDSDNKVVLAAWTATLATITFLITFVGRPLIRKVFGIKSPKIKAGISHKIIQSVMGAGMLAPDLTCTIENGSSALFFERPVIKLSRKIHGADKYTDLLIHATNIDRPRFPLQLQPGERKTIEFDTISLYNDILQHMNDKDTVRFIVRTTVRKTYKSNKMTKENIVGHIQIAQSV